MHHIKTMTITYLSNGAILNHMQNISLNIKGLIIVREINIKKII